jgi:hypothetical protein
MKLDLEKGASSITEATKLLADDPFAFMVHDEVCITEYEPENLTKWEALTQWEGSIFTQKALWIVIILQVLTAFACAGAIYYFTHDPTGIKADSLTAVVKVMTVSIAFLLGMFMSACLSRWWDTVKSIESLFGSIKKLVMTAINLQLPEEFCNNLARTCVLSVLMMETEMTIAKTPGSQEENWKKRFDELEKSGQIAPAERMTLESVSPMERSFFSWSLVSNHLCEIRDQLVTGGIPDTVAYDRLCELVGVGTSSVSALKTIMTFQIPFVYVHMLAFMVHAVNLLNALGAGVAIGLTFAAHKQSGKIDYGAIGNALMFLILQSFIYQAFLTIGAALSFPVTGNAYKIPLSRMTATLERQLKTMSKLSFDSPQSGRGSRSQSASPPLPQRSPG